MRLSTSPPPAVSEATIGIGRAAAECGVSERALRYYEEIGLLAPEGRTPGGMRRYAERDLQRVKQIRELQTLLGLNLDEIRTVLHSDDRLGAIREEYRSTRTGKTRRRQLLTEGLSLRIAVRDAIDDKLAGLERYREEVEAAIRKIEGLLADPETG